MRKKTGVFLLSLCPVLLWILIQSLVVTGVGPFMYWLQGIAALLGADTGSFGAFLEKNQIYMIYLLMDIVVLLPAVLWFRRLPERENRREGGFFGLSLPGILLLLLIGVCLQAVSSLFLSLVFSTFPGQMEAYSQVLENLGMNDPTFLSLLYTAAVAPVTEEMIFRGLSLRILEGGFPFWAANILQALYFGIMHGNLVQGSYAFLAGMVLGYLVKKKGTLAAGILCHFGVNISGVVLGLL